MEKQIRVLVANRPKLMREVIIATFVDQPDIQIVGEVTEDSEIVGRVEETKPDFLFIGPQRSRKASRCLRHGASPLSRTEHYCRRSPHQPQRPLLGLFQYSFHRPRGFRGGHPRRHAQEGRFCRSSNMMTLPGFGLLGRHLAGALLLSALVANGFAQEAPAQRRSSAPPADVPADRRAGVSDLAKENYNRVAASAMDIKGVLLGNPGLMVELKNLIAKEASDSGQVVNEDDLTDQAISGRLINDVAFRAAATRLVQRYRYLLPRVNPDSDAAKEQDLILKERTRRFVQIESQEDSNSLQPRRTERTQDRNGAPCAQGNSFGCNLQYGGQQGRAAGAPSNAVPQDQLPQGAPGQANPSSANSNILRAQMSSEEPQAGGLAEGLPSSVLTNVSNPQRRPSDAIPGNNLPPDLSGNSPLSQGQASNPYSPDIHQWAPDLNSTMTPGPGRRAPYQPELQPRGTPRVPTANERAPVGMVHQPSPYSDIPSLYDLYVQAASQNGAPQRFGVEVFRDGLRDPRAIPMDLPLGPDYVVGPGDTLSIDLWGGVSARLVRNVDREGRVGGRTRLQAAPAACSPWGTNPSSQLMAVI
jgi:hypothetical protein